MPVATKPANDAPNRGRLAPAAGAAAAAVISLGALTAAAQTQSPADADAARRALDARQSELEATRSKAQNILTTVADLDSERERLNARLVETAALIQRSEAQLTSIEGRLSELEAQEKMVRGSLGERHGQIATLLGALQRMGRNPPPVLITRREDALKMVRSAMLLSSAFPELRGQALKLAGQLGDLVRVMTNIRSEGERLQAETDALTESRKRLSNLMEAKKLTIAERQSELQSVRAATDEISKSVESLEQLITKLDENPTLKEKSGIAAYEAQSGGAPQSPTVVVDAGAKTAAVIVTPDMPYEPSAAPQPSTTATVAPADEPKEIAVAILQAPQLKSPVAELKPSPAALSALSPGRMKPAMPFADARTKLPLPAHGRRALSFGERTQYGGQSKGLVLETRSGAQITSPTDGWILYAGNFRSYGQLLIINAGDGYHILLAGMSRIDVQPGQFVLAAEPVGAMGGTAKASQSAAEVGAPVLYVEFRKDGRPIDPEPWWATGQQKVQG